jgi:hypothetical protein
MLRYMSLNLLRGKGNIPSDMEFRGAVTNMAASYEGIWNLFLGPERPYTQMFSWFSLATAGKYQYRFYSWPRPVSAT